MAITIPKKIEKLSHGGVVKELLEANSNFKVPSRTEWPKHVPDLVHKTKKVTVEVEMSNLETGWGQCLSYYRLGSEIIHLILPPRLFRQFKQDEKNYVIKNPIPNIEVHQLPIVERKRGRPPTKKRVSRSITVADPAEKFYDEKQKKPFSRMRPWNDEEQDYRKSLSKKVSMTKIGSKRGRPKSKSRLLPNATEPCDYCHLFPASLVFLYCLSCGRLV